MGADLVLPIAVVLGAGVLIFFLVRMGSSEERGKRKRIQRDLKHAQEALDRTARSSIDRGRLARLGERMRNRRK